MGKDLRGKELGEGIYQQPNGTYCARFVDRFGKRKSKRSKKLQEVRQWIADASYIDEHSDINQAPDMMVDAWYEYWIGIKQKTVKPIHCQKIFTDMADEGYKTSTIHQARITLYNMLEFARENDVILNNPCKKSVKSDMGKPSDKKEALTIDVQKKFLEAAEGQSYENQFRFVLQTGLRTGELVGLKWEDIDFVNKTIKISRTMEYRYSVGEWRVGSPKSQSGYRTIPLTDEAIRILRAQKEKNKNIKIIPIEWAEHVFLCRKGEPVKNSTYDTALFKICDKDGIKRFSMHVLRHTFATRCIEGGMLPKTLQKILGHSNIGITMNLYVHITEDEKKREIDLVASALNVI